jgi:hypothetical protein
MLEVATESPTSPRNPTLRYSSVLALSLIILGGDGGAVLVFCLGKGGEGGSLDSAGFWFTFSFAGVAGLLTAFVRGWRRTVWRA